MFALLFHKSKKKKAFTEEEKRKIVEQIHHEFDTASDKALNAANVILGNVKTEVIQKADRLEKLGFNSSAVVNVAKKEKETLQMSKETADIIALYRQKYPLYKFISEADVIAICSKYGLLCGPVSRYIGDVPEKNLKDMESFKIKDEDIPWKHEITEIQISSYHSESETPMRRAIDDRGPVYTKEPAPSNTYSREAFYKDIISETIKDLHGISIGHINGLTGTSERAKEFTICAPPTDFNRQGMKKKGFVLSKSEGVNVEITDPVVLQRVHGGFLVVTAWGAEASDPIIINSINN